ncbi:hypothetical protein UNH65_12710 [Chitinophaga sp. 180180018-2]|nr:hypothetical protein [Chitinophaga sp. 212800010-3]
MNFGTSAGANLDICMRNGVIFIRVFHSIPGQKPPLNESIGLGVQGYNCPVVIIDAGLIQAISQGTALKMMV